MSAKKTLFYLSFAEDNRFLGALFIYSSDYTTAILDAHRLGLNPGGQVFGCEVPAGEEAKIVLPQYIGRLLNERELRESDPHVRTHTETDTMEQFLEKRTEAHEQRTN